MWKRERPALPVTGRPMRLLDHHRASGHGATLLLYRLAGNGVQVNSEQRRVNRSPRSGSKAPGQWHGYGRRSRRRLRQLPFPSGCQRLS